MRQNDKWQGTRKCRGRERERGKRYGKRSAYIEKVRDREIGSQRKKVTKKEEKRDRDR